MKRARKVYAVEYRNEAIQGLPVILAIVTSIARAVEVAQSALDGTGETIATDAGGTLMRDAEGRLYYHAATAATVRPSIVTGGIVNVFGADDHTATIRSFDLE